MACERRGELAHDHRRILRPEPKRDQSAGIAEHGMPDLILKLEQMLVGQREPDAIFAELRHHVGESQGGERLELIHVEKEWPS